MKGRRLVENIIFTLNSSNTVAQTRLLVTPIARSRDATGAFFQSRDVRPLALREDAESRREVQLPVTVYAHML